MSTPYSIRRRKVDKKMELFSFAKSTPALISYICITRNVLILGSRYKLPHSQECRANALTSLLLPGPMISSLCNIGQWPFKHCGPFWLMILDVFSWLGLGNDLSLLLYLFRRHTLSASSVDVFVLEILSLVPATASLLQLLCYNFLELSKYRKRALQ